MEIKYVNNRLLQLVLLIVIICLINKTGYSQLRNENFAVKWGSWLLLQAIPSPGLYEDKGGNNSGIKFGLEWQVIPLSYSWSANKYVSKFSVLKIPPVKRFSGSAEIYFEPVLIPGGFKNNTLKKFMFKSGARLVFPVFHGGEYLSFSLGAGYYRQQTTAEIFSGPSYEAAIYSFFGMLGVKFNYNQNALSRYNIGLYFKYY